MTAPRIDLNGRETHGVRASLLEAITDGVFDSEASTLEQSDRLLADLAAGTARATHGPQESRTIEMDAGTLVLIDRSLAHVAASIGAWELPIRVGLTNEELVELRARFAALARGSA